MEFDASGLRFDPSILPKDNSLVINKILKVILNRLPSQRMTANDWAWALLAIPEDTHTLTAMIYGVNQEYIRYRYAIPIIYIAD